MGKVKVIRQSCFAMEIWESERHLLGEKDYPWGKRRKRISVDNPQSLLAVCRQVVRSG